MPAEEPTNDPSSYDYYSIFIFYFLSLKILIVVVNYMNTKSVLVGLGVLTVGIPDFIKEQSLVFSSRIPLKNAK